VETKMIFLQKLLCGSAKRRERGIKRWGGVLKEENAWRELGRGKMGRKRRGEGNEGRD
jgi:hypothetical protein